VAANGVLQPAAMDSAIIRPICENLCGSLDGGMKLFIAGDILSRVNFKVLGQEYYIHVGRMSSIVSGILSGLNVA
jgi:hypothetical protein